jgi:hypothetical protein
MSLASAEIVVYLLESYVGTGLAFAAIFIPFGVQRVDPHVSGSPAAVRALIAPGIVVFWPLLAWRWVRG